MDRNLQIKYYFYRIGFSLHTRSNGRLTGSLQYPEIIPNFSLELSHNNQIPPHVKANLLNELRTYAEENVGVAMTYLVVDWLKDNVDSLIPSGLKKEEVKTEQLTKRQKNKITNYANSNTRGRDWVDIIRHLSQTGNPTTAE